jgi:RNA polymerase sigma-70 factor (ECF subfamily)
MKPARDDPRSDGELVDAANDGDLSAFEALYYRHRDWVIQLALRFGADHQDALDVLQDTFTYLWKKFPGFRLTARMRTFLYPAVKHLAVDVGRSRRRHRTDGDALEKVAAREAPSTSREDLAEALRSLPEEQKEVLLMRFVDGMTLAEIASALCVPLGTVKSRQHNALRALRDDPRIREYFRE